MKAVVLTETGFEIGQAPMPKPNEDQVLVRAYAYVGSTAASGGPGRFLGWSGQAKSWRLAHACAASNLVIV